MSNFRLFRRWSALAAPAVLLGVVSCSSASDSADRAQPSNVTVTVGSEPDDPVGTGSVEPTISVDPTIPIELVQPEGFSTVTALITDADGEVCEVCLWLADESGERSRGLMGVTDLGTPMGMVFEYDQSHDGSFYMFQTPTPLSIVWINQDGDLVGSTDMSPCLDSPAADCARYSPDSPYVLAIEVFVGGLEPLGLLPGAHVELIPNSESATCQSNAGV